MTRFRLTGYSDGSVETEKLEDDRPCTCHPDDSPPVPCAEKYAYSECVQASFRSEAIELLTAVTQSDGKVSDLLWNQIQAALKKWGEA